MRPQEVQAVARFLGERVLPVLQRLDAVVVDGGTDAGVMQAMGRAIRSCGSHIPLVGVAPEGTVVVPGGAAATLDCAAIEPNHSHLILVPGSAWGDESPWLADIATTLAGDAPSATLVINGGGITYADVGHSITRHRPVIVVSGTGRTADAIAAAVAGHGTVARATALMPTRIIRVVEFEGDGGIAEAVEAYLTM